MDEVKAIEGEEQSVVGVPNTNIGTLIAIINGILPDVLELRAVNDDITLYILVKSNIETPGGSKTSTWQPLHVMYSEKDKITYLKGYLSGLETISNYELLMQLELSKNPEATAETCL